MFVGLLHFLISPDYHGKYETFIKGYVIDILLPMNLYLLLQVSLRRMISKARSRIFGALITFILGIAVEFLQWHDIHILGTTFDPLDIVMYGSGIFLGILIDLLLLEIYESHNPN